MEVTIVAFTSLWPMLVLTRTAIRSTEPGLLEVARVLQLGVVKRSLSIVLPAALPRIFVAVRLSAAIALIVAVTVEVVANPIGLGYGMMMAAQSLHPAASFAFLVWIGLVGWIFNGAFRPCRTALLHHVPGAGMRRETLSFERHLVRQQRAGCCCAAACLAIRRGCRPRLSRLLPGAEPDMAHARQRLRERRHGGRTHGHCGTRLWRLGHRVRLGIVLGAPDRHSAPHAPISHHRWKCCARCRFPLWCRFLSAFSAIARPWSLPSLPSARSGRRLLGTIHGFSTVEPRLYEVAKA